jgi:carboxyl-terminal processing protease
VTLAALLTALASFQAQTAEPPTDFATLWKRVKYSISMRYYARQMRQEEMERLFSKHGPAASRAKSRREFGDAVNAMIRDFGDSHFDFLTPDDQGFYALGSLVRKDLPEAPHIGAWFKKLPDGYTVQMILNATPAEEAGLRKGDLVLSVDGQPFSPIASLRNKIGHKVNLSVRRKGQTFAKTVEVRGSKGMQLFLEATRNSARVMEQDGKKIGYFRLWTMAGDEFREALASAVYGPLKDTDGFILDLRDGFGGRPEGFGDPFFRPEARIEWKFGAASAGRQLFGYQRPLVLLVNGGSRSAKEVFSHILKRSGRATLVGTTTAGHVLGTSPFLLEDWALLEIPMVDVIADGERLEGKGVRPHVEVSTELDENGKDLQLAKALEVVIDKIAGKDPLSLKEGEGFTSRPTLAGRPRAP